jgi:hypothetical protein
MGAIASRRLEAVATSSLAPRSNVSVAPDTVALESRFAWSSHVGHRYEAIAAASPTRLEELCRIVVAKVVVRDGAVESIEWTPPARPFFDRQRECPQGGSGTRPLSGDDPLAWYVA